MKNYKRIPFDNMSNCRDLGGYACEGGMFDYNRLYRSDVPSGLNDDEWKIIYEEMGVRTIIDLRSQYEQMYMGYTPAHGINYISNPLQDDICVTEESCDIKKAALKAFGNSLDFAYSNMFESKPDRFAKVLNYIASGLEEGAVLFHCTAGKDRTGIITALLYMLCEVAKDDIVADYQVTETYCGKLNATVVIPDDMRFMLESPAFVMRQFLRNVEEKQYIPILIKNGLTKESIQMIKDRCILK